jgi:hypothetical protein
MGGAACHEQGSLFGKKLIARNEYAYYATRMDLELTHIDISLERSKIDARHFCAPPNEVFFRAGSFTLFFPLLESNEHFCRCGAVGAMRDIHPYCSNGFARSDLCGNCRRLRGARSVLG